MKENKTDAVHFSLGEGAGDLLVNIAREFIMYKLDPNKALDAIQGSLIGCPKDVALDIIAGKIVLITDPDGCHFNSLRYTPDMKKIHPPFDIEGWAERTLLDMKQEAREWRVALTELKNAIIKNDGSFSFEVSYDNLMKYFYEGNESRLIGVDDDEIANVKCAVLGVKNFIAGSLKKMEVIKWLYKAYPNEIPDGFLSLPVEVSSLNMTLTDMMLKQDDIEMYIGRNKWRDTLVTKYLENEREIAKIITYGIQPNEITDGYDAGWLAPNGDYYGLNGDYANMIHNQLATALWDAQIIPRRDEECQTNPDGWLCEHGWVRIHKDHVLFDGYLQSKYGRPLFKITEAQRSKLIQYGNACHNGRLMLGCTYMPVAVSTLEYADNTMMEKFFDL